MHAGNSFRFPARFSTLSLLDVTSGGIPTMKMKGLAWAAGWLALSTAAVFAATPTMSVQVRKAEIRSSPSFLGKVVASVGYGERVLVEQQNRDWMRVASAGQSGWMHASALTTKRIIMKAGEAAQTGASSGEMALAGKGFNSDVEAQFKANHKEIDFGPVDRMEKIAIPAPALLKFAAEGGLVMQGGAP